MTLNRKIPDDGFVKGSGNVFEDLGISDPTIQSLKADLAIRLNELIDEQACSQAELASKLGLQQPHISQIKHYKLKGFSVERLMELIVKLGVPVEVQVGQSRSAHAQLRVVTKVSRIATRAYGDFVNESRKTWKPVTISATVRPHVSAISPFEDFDDAPLLPTQKVIANFSKRPTLQ